jgi:hypothetical protein
MYLDPILPKLSIKNKEVKIGYTSQSYGHLEGSSMISIIKDSRQERNNSDMSPWDTIKYRPPKSNEVTEEANSKAKAYRRISDNFNIDLS